MKVLFVGCSRSLVDDCRQLHRQDGVWLGVHGHAVFGHDPYPEVCWPLVRGGCLPERQAEDQDLMRGPGRKVAANF